MYNTLSSFGLPYLLTVNKVLIYQVIPVYFGCVGSALLPIILIFTRSASSNVISFFSNKGATHIHYIFTCLNNIDNIFV